MPFLYRRTIRFHETDAAGVMYFANLLSLCHEAYEAAIAAAGFDLATFFSASGAVALPIVHTSADFFRPMQCGDMVAVQLKTQLLTADSFEISYEVYPQREGVLAVDGSGKCLANALTRHVCISPQTRHRQALPAELIRWVEGFSQDADFSQEH
ncbi:MAG: thioesterase family protein [Cyanobacteria bacterium J06614_10]